MRSYYQYIEDISNITNLPKPLVRNLMWVLRLIVANDIYECMTRNDDTYEVFLVGFGKMTIEYNPDTDDYNVGFKLSKDMKSMIDKVLDTQESPLNEELDTTITKQIIEKYKKVVDIDE